MQPLRHPVSPLSLCLFTEANQVALGLGMQTQQLRKHDHSSRQEYAKRERAISPFNYARLYSTSYAVGGWSHLHNWPIATAVICMSTPRTVWSPVPWRRNETADCVPSRRRKRSMSGSAKPTRWPSKKRSESASPLWPVILRSCGKICRRPTGKRSAWCACSSRMSPCSSGIRFRAHPLQRWRSPKPRPATSPERAGSEEDSRRGRLRSGSALGSSQGKRNRQPPE